LQAQKYITAKRRTAIGRKGKEFHTKNESFGNESRIIRANAAKKRNKKLAKAVLKKEIDEALTWCYTPNS
jgi:hypothetical protein